MLVFLWVSCSCCLHLSLCWCWWAWCVQCSQCDVVITCNKWEKFVVSFSVYSFHWRRRQSIGIQYLWEATRACNHIHLSQRLGENRVIVFIRSYIFTILKSNEMIHSNANGERTKVAGAVTAYSVRADTSRKALHMRIMDLFRWFGSACPTNAAQIVRANDEYLHNISIQRSTFHIHCGYFGSIYGTTYITHIYEDPGRSSNENHNENWR